MPTPEFPSSMMMPFKDVFLVVYPLVEMDETSGTPTPTGAYACFVMREKQESLLAGPPTGAGLRSSPTMRPQPRNPEWSTIRVVMRDGSKTYKSVKDAFEAAIGFADLELYGVV
jgi:hypothetical protein